MKRLTKLFMASLLVGMCSFGYAQDYGQALQKIEPTDRVLGTIIRAKQYQSNECASGCEWGKIETWYYELLINAKLQHPTKNVDIRQMTPSKDDGSLIPWKGPVRGVIIEVTSSNSGTNFNNQKWSLLKNAIDKSFANVRDGSRIAIDQVTVLNGENREEYKDHLVDILLERGYKVVAKDYLDRLYEEQQAQQSGIYNDRTTVKENNFSAVGYYINVKVTETTLRVQVINVSTGEYEGNTTINL